MARIIGWIPEPEAEKVSPIEVAAPAPKPKAAAKKAKAAPRVDDSVGDDGGVPLGDPRA
jgi:hypothetical protein